MSFLNRDKTGVGDSLTEERPKVQAKPKAGITATSLSPSHLAQTTLLAADVTINGNIISKGEIHIDGRIEGDVRCAAVTVGEGGQVTGSVIAEDAVIGGHVLGTVRSLKVTLRSTAHVEGDITHNTLGMEQGAYFEGNSRRSENPTAASSPKKPISDRAK